MTLSTEDGQLYYKLWFPLLDYVNEKYKVNENLAKMAEAKSLNPNEVKTVADKLWDDVTVIDEYLSSLGDIPQEHKAIVSGWKRRIRGRFVLERHLKKGSIFISMDDEKVYQVSGIISSWEEMFPYGPMPLMLDATFMPFKDVIISDGLVMPYNIMLGRNMTKTFKEVYMAAKKSGRLQKTL